MQKFYFLRSIVLGLLLTSSSLVLSAQDLTHTLVKLFNNTPELQEVVVDVPAVVESEQWNSPHIRVILEINTSGLTEKSFKTVLMTGRYRVVGSRLGNTYTLTAPQLALPVTMNGQDIAESVVIKVMVPKGVSVRNSAVMAVAPATSSPKS